MRDDFYRTFEETYRGGRQLIKDRLAVYLPFVEPLLLTHPAASAIDLGCGRGEWLEILRAKGFSPVGVDLDAGMLEACHAAGLAVLHDDALKVLAALPDQSQTLVSAFHVVEHLEFELLQTLIAHAFRVLKPGGLLIMETPNPENIVVGTTGFYTDPTHQRPIPPLLLTFLTEFNRFHRVKTLRLQEPPSLRSREEPGLLDVLGGVSPDYAVVAQKEGDSVVMAALDTAFAQEYGISLESLASRYDLQINTRMHKINARMNQSENHIQEQIQNLQEKVSQQETDARYWHEQARHWQEEADQRYQQILQLHNSASWRLTRPLRGLKRALSGDFSPARQVAAAAQRNMKTGLKTLLRASIAFVMRHPALKRHIQSRPRLFSWLKAQASTLARFSENASSGYAHPVSSARAEQIFRFLHTARQRGKDTQAALAPLPVPASEPQKRPRLAYISPLPPEESGISDYSAELLPVLSRWYEIDVIVHQKEVREEAKKTVSDPWIRANCPVRSLEWFRGHAEEFNRVLYHFGNSHFHAHMFDLLDEIPGVVVLHDFFISGIQSCREILGRGAPHTWMRALYHSHGYPALCANHQNQKAAIWKYPANLPVLQAALGVIVHSEYARHQAARWYEPAERWAVLPHLRVAVQNVDRASARQTLGIAPEDFMVCAFGNLGPTKQNERLLKIWLQSPLAQDPRAKLVFAGGGGDERHINQRIKTAGMEGRVRVTGWLSAQDFRHYLAAADIGVQLRTLSRGETSGTVLDCMNYSLPTIANANGSMADLDPAAVCLLPDEFDDHELAEALTALWRDPERRRKMGQHARKIVETLHDPEHCARLYAKAIENHYRTSENSRLHNLITQISHNLPESETQALAVTLAADFPPTPRKRRLFVDISELVTVDVKTGIQRVVRAILREWLRREAGEWQVEPVYAAPGGYCYARQFTSRFLGISGEWAEDAPVEAWAGDCFFGLDLNPARIVEQKAVLEHWHDRGVVIGFLVYDLLAMSHPECFVAGAAQNHQRWLETICAFDFSVCISRSVAEELQQWLAASEQIIPVRIRNETRRRAEDSALARQGEVDKGSFLMRTGIKRQRPYHIGWSHIGADLGASVPTRGIPPDGVEQLQALRARATFLMVGTLEPRKAHGEVLAAFEKLWAEGKDINLVMVGKQGWMVDALAQHLKTRMAEEKRLIWLQGISDEYLDAVYAASTCLIAASYGEGFGLPLIEAARHKLPVIARDIPVFREVAGQHACYFTDNLTHTIETWLALHAENQHPKSDQMPWLSWQESAERLWDQVTDVRL
ncbi:hypothetical protein AGMMS50289_16370 [Betaproteobacteria bacterium]|nr:hypothetical protein AGMMS50289_16370 [Betaproteobacteria bacterium]